MAGRVKMKPEDKRMATNKWRREVVKTYKFYLHKEHDKEAYEWMEKQPNKRQYLIDLVKEDMNGHKKPTNEKD